MDEVTRSLWGQFDPQPLKPSESDLRVELDAERSGESGLATRITNRILVSPRPTHHVVSGHRGSGKSTELLRVKQILDEKKVFAIFAALNEDIDNNDVDLLDVLVAVVRHVSTDVDSRLGVELKPGYFHDRVRRLWDLLKSPIEFENLKLTVLFAQLSVAIKGSPKIRSELRDAFEPDAGNWLHAVNDVLDQARLELHRKGFSDLCIIVDELDKLSRVTHARANCPISENLFVNRAPQLTQLKCHVIYAIPLELAISHNAPTLKQNYGNEVPVISMVRVRKRPPSLEPDTAGIEKLREVCDRRCHKIGRPLTDLCPPEVLDQVILLSGGQPTELMTLISECLLRSRPFTPAIVEDQAARGQRDYEFLRGDHWDLLESAQKDGQFERTRENEEAVRELLASRALLQYVNGNIWYRPNPYVERLKRPQ